MAAYFWVGGTGTLDNTSTGNISLSSGGASGAGPWGSGDSLTFNGSSGGGTATLGGNVVGLSMGLAGYTGTLAFGTNKISLGGNAGTIFAGSTSMAVSGTPLIEFTYAGSTGTRTWQGPASGSGIIGLAVVAGSDIVAVTNRVRSINFTGFTGSWANGARTIYGDLTLGAGMTVTDGASVTTWSAGGGPTSATIISNGVTLNAPLAFSAAAQTVRLGDALNTGARGITVTTTCTFETQGYNLTTASLTSSATGARTINLGASTVTITGSGTAFDMTGASTTVTAGSALVAMTSASAKTFAGGGKSYGTLRQAGAGDLSVTGANTFVTIDNTVTPATIILPSGVTTTVTNLSIAGILGSVFALRSSTPGSPATLSKASGTVDLAYVLVTDITATGGATFNAFTSNGCVNGGGNTGWNFSAPAGGAPPSLTATATITAPGVGGGTLVTAPGLTAAATLDPPTVRGGAAVAAPALAATATLNPPGFAGTPPDSLIARVSLTATLVSVHSLTATLS